MDVVLADVGEDIISRIQFVKIPESLREVVKKIVGGKGNEN